MAMQNQQVIQGKIVESVDVVRAMDVPMDGGIYYFPLADRTAMYTKRWLANGTTQIDEFRRVDPEQQTAGQQTGDESAQKTVMDTLGGMAGFLQKMGSEIGERLNGIDAKIQKIEKNMGSLNKSRTQSQADDKK